MPSRKDVFKNLNYYHIYNRTIDKKLIFLDHNLASIFLDTANFYRYINHKISYSVFRRMITKDSQKYKEEHFMNPGIKIVCYVLMPNHYHFILRQQADAGIVKFISNLTNSFTRYFNVLHNRRGPLFLTQFCSVHIRTPVQLTYTSKYIHLNPLKAKIISSTNEIVSYRWSSLRTYLYGLHSEAVDPSYVMKYFQNSSEEYLKYLKLKKS